MRGRQITTSVHCSQDLRSSTSLIDLSQAAAGSHSPPGLRVLLLTYNRELLGGLFA
jgi:hypothetical protein